MSDIIAIIVNSRVLYGSHYSLTHTQFTYMCAQETRTRTCRPRTHTRTRTRTRTHSYIAPIIHTNHCHLPLAPHVQNAKLNWELCRENILKGNQLFNSKGSI